MCPEPVLANDLCSFKHKKTAPSQAKKRRFFPRTATVVIPQILHSPVPPRAAAARQRHTFFEFFLCLSRACLGQNDHFSLKWRKKCRCLTCNPHPRHHSQPRCYHPIPLVPLPGSLQAGASALELDRSFPWRRRRRTRLAWTLILRLRLRLRDDYCIDASSMMMI